MKRMLFNATQQEELRVAIVDVKNSLISISKLPAANSAKATSTKVSLPVLNLPLRPALLITAKSVMASCHLRK